MEKKEHSAPLGAISAINRIIRAEITEEKERQKHLYASGTRGRITLVILAAAIIANIELFFLTPGYPLLLITASFFLFMFYFITLIIPRTIKGGPRSLKKDILGYVGDLRETGFFKSAGRFVRIFLNAFFINCRPLFFGFALLFSIDIVLALSQYNARVLSDAHAGIIIFQSAAIIVFYFLVWKLEPYSTEFSSDISGVKDHLIKKNVPAAVVSFLFIAGTAITLVSILSVIILLPGVTVNNVLSEAEFTEIGHVFFAIALVLVPLYFIFRYIHGITSRDLLLKFSQQKTEQLARQAHLTRDACEAFRTSHITDDASRETLSAATELLIEARLYQVEKKTIFGTFPVYVVTPDFQMVFNARDFSAPSHGEKPACGRK